MLNTNRVAEGNLGLVVLVVSSRDLREIGSVVLRNIWGFAHLFKLKLKQSCVD